jgi:hypothetical protein
MTSPASVLETVQMFDSITAANLPDGDRFAAYVNGDWANCAQVRERFPAARVFGIDVLGDSWPTARILDFEHGDVTDKVTLRNFVERRNAYRPRTATVYCDRSNLGTVEGWLEGLWHDLWISTLDGTILTGQRTASGNLIVATQYRGGPDDPYDISDTLKSWT